MNKKITEKYYEAWSNKNEKGEETCYVLDKKDIDSKVLDKMTDFLEKNTAYANTNWTDEDIDHRFDKDIKEYWNNLYSKRHKRNFYKNSEWMALYLYLE